MSGCQSRCNSRHIRICMSAAASLLVAAKTTHSKAGANEETGRMLKPDARTLKLWNAASEKSVQPSLSKIGRPI